MPCKSRTTLCESDAMFCKNDTIPRKSNTMLRKSGTTPCKNDAMPCKSGTTLCENDTIFRKSSTIPCKSATVFCKSNAMPRKNATTPCKSDKTHIKERILRPKRSAGRLFFDSTSRDLFKKPSNRKPICPAFPKPPRTDSFASGNGSISLCPQTSIENPKKKKQKSLNIINIQNYLVLCIA